MNAKDIGLEIAKQLIAELFHAAIDGRITGEDAEHAKRLAANLAASRIERAAAERIMRGKV